uniref:Succinate dehydrogenase subunit 4 n=1 Tax=Tsukubamonas globosa TaxID=875863 RepID=W8VJW3_9EUKA|nr:succinate dehydrogenase subunit 4 [Tsukubamonas globosa]BAO51985.1 succinate dehydrogenase subunit 4 [Tsukubamonas globosa]
MNQLFSLLQNAQGVQIKSSVINTKILFNHDTLNVLLSFFFLFMGHLYILGRFDFMFTIFFPVLLVGSVFTFIHMRLGMQNIILDYVHNLTVRTIMMHMLDVCYLLLLLSI